MVSDCSVRPAVLIERVGNEVMAVVPGRTECIMFSGDVVRVLMGIQAGETLPGSDATLADLEKLGIVSRSGMSRRGLLKAGAIGAGAGVAVMAMPGIAAASSVQVFELIGTFFSVGEIFEFEVTSSRVGTTFPDPLPSTNQDDVSELSIGGITLNVFDTQLGLGEGSDDYIKWSGAVPGFTQGDVGTFTWRGSDGIIRQYVVTFSLDSAPYIT